MSNKADPHAFGKFVPGFDFLQQLAQGGAASLAGWVAPTLDAQALDKRIEELKAVQFWLDQNATALKATLQALEVQKMTLATLHNMNAQASPQAQQTSAMPDPLQFWNALTQQFQQIANAAMQNLDTRGAQAPAPAAGGTPKPKAAPRKRRKAAGS